MLETCSRPDAPFLSGARSIQLQTLRTTLRKSTAPAEKKKELFHRRVELTMTKKVER
jgi:hypothetical protein